MQAPGLEAGISKSEVSRVCAELDESLDVFRHRQLDHVAFPWVFLDATYPKGQTGGGRHRDVLALLYSSGVSSGTREAAVDAVSADSK